jgi:hypothetical protein
MLRMLRILPKKLTFVKQRGLKPSFLYREVLRTLRKQEEVLRLKTALSGQLRDFVTLVTLVTPNYFKKKTF